MFYRCLLYYFNFSVYLKFFIIISWRGGESTELYKSLNPKPAKDVSYMFISIATGARRPFRDYGMAGEGHEGALHLEVVAAWSWTSTYILAQEIILKQLPLPGCAFCCNYRETHISSFITTSIKQNLTSLWNLLPKPIQHPPNTKRHQKLETKHKWICVHYYSVGVNCFSQIKWLFFLKVLSNSQPQPGY